VGENVRVNVDGNSVGAPDGRFVVGTGVGGEVGFGVGGEVGFRVGSGYLQ
jgi:hypothetical protein